MAITSQATISYHIRKVEFDGGSNEVKVILTKKIDNTIIDENTYTIDPSAVMFLLDSAPNTTMTIRNQIMLGIEQYLITAGICSGVMDTNV
jgi:hypothetical protein